MADLVAVFVLAVVVFLMIALPLTLGAFDLLLQNFLVSDSVKLARYIARRIHTPTGLILLIVMVFVLVMGVLAIAAQNVPIGLGCVAVFLAVGVVLALRLDP